MRIRKNTRKAERKEIAFSLIEMSMMIGLLTWLSLAATDIAAVMVSKTALRVAAETALRCVTPLKGNCRELKVEERLPLYAWYKEIHPVTPEYSVKEVNYRGEMKYLKLPIHELSNFRVKILDQLLFDLPVTEHDVNVPYYKWVQKIKSNEMIKGLPSISGGDPRNPSFTGVPGSSEILKITKEIPGGTITQGGERQVARIRINKKASYSTECFARDGEDLKACKLLENDKIKIALHVKGTSSGTGATTCGGASLRVAGGLNKELGGQAFRGPGAGNFYPRGIPFGQVDPTLKNSDARGHFEKYSSIEIPFGEWVEVWVGVSGRSPIPDEVCDPGNIQYNVSTVDFYVPELRDASTEVPCREDGRRSTKSRDFICTPASTFGSQLQQLVPDAFVVKEVLNLDGSVNIDSVARSPRPLDREEPTRWVLEERRSVSDADHQEGLYYDHAEEVGSRPAGFETFPMKCRSDTFLGTLINLITLSVPENADPDGFVRNSQQAGANCGLPDIRSGIRDKIFPAGFSQAGYNTITHIRWSETEVPLNNFSYDWTKNTCDAVAPTSFQGLDLLNQIPVNKRRADDRDTGRFEVLLTGRETHTYPEDPHDPDIIKRDDPRYASCSDITVGRRVYDEGVSELPRGTLFDGFKANSERCGGADSYKDILRTEASGENISEAYRLPPNAFFEPSISAQRQLTVNEPPTNACATWYRTNIQPLSEFRPVSGGPFAENSIPTECQGDQRVYCQQSYAGLSGDGSGPELTTDFERAEEIGLKALRTVLPKTALVGKAPQVKVSKVVDGNGMVRSTASTEVMSWALGGHKFPMKEVSLHRAEEVFAR